MNAEHCGDMAQDTVISPDVAGDAARSTTMCRPAWQIANSGSGSARLSGKLTVRIKFRAVQRVYAYLQPFISKQHRSPVMPPGADRCVTAMELPVWAMYAEQPLRIVKPGSLAVPSTYAHASQRHKRR